MLSSNARTRNAADRSLVPRPRRARAVLAATACAAAALLMMMTGCSSPGPKADAPAREYSFWPPFPAEPRMQFLTAFATSADVQPPQGRFADMVYGKEREVLPINKPYGVAMWNGRIYVCDSRNGALLVLDLRARQVRLMGTTGMARMSSPTDVSIAADGIKYVSDHARGAVFVFDVNDRHLTSFGYPGFKPTGLAVHQDELFVCDLSGQEIVVMDRRSGQELRRFGGRGDEDGKFIWPLGIAADQQGNLYVSDVLRCRIQKFSREGQFLSAWGQAGDTFGSFVRPKLLAADSAGIVYIIDAAFQNVQMFDDQSRLLMFFGGAGGHAGSMRLPAGIAVHEGDIDLFQAYIHPAFKAERLVLVTNQFGPHKVAVYAMGRLKEGRTVQDVASAMAPLPSGTHDGPGLDPLMDSQGSGGPEGSGAEPPRTGTPERENR